MWHQARHRHRQGVGARRLRGADRTAGRLGLAVNGADGVRDVLDHLRGELVRTMQLCGASSIDEITHDLVA